MRNSRLSLVASLVIAAVLALLALTTATSVVAVVRSGDHVTSLRAVATTYVDLERVVAEEAIGEAGYRRRPSPAARRSLEEAIAKVDDALLAIQEAGTHRDAASVTYLRMLNQRYVTEVRATLDSPLPRRVDDRVAGPALDSMQALLNTAIDARRTNVKQAIDEQSVVVQRLTFVLPSVFLLAFGVLGWVWWSMLADRRRLHSVAAHHESQALTDSLTDLPNRTALRRRVESALSRPGSRGALLFLDLDRFKPVNDSLGHQAGDALLQQVARRLEGTVRDGDLAARVGGDEFAVFLPRAQDAASVADRILRSIEAPFLVEGHLVTIGVSIGIAECPLDGTGYASLLQSADAALYRAKGAGRGRVEVAGRGPQQTA